jgi:DNA-binding response OmpR family regulator
MTAYGSEEKRDEALDLGASDYFEKPFEIKDVKKLVMNILG